MTRLGLPFQGQHQRREAEWVGALILFGVAVALLLPGATFSRPTFDAFGAIAPEGTWGASLLGVSVIRMIALWVNGSKRAEINGQPAETRQVVITPDGQRVIEAQLAQGSLSLRSRRRA